MNDDQLFLKPNIQVEPLFDRWYAWSHLISPATAARNITERHLPIMDSYISAPEFHASAVKDPKMLGGPFVDHGGKRVDEIEALRAATVEKRARLLKFSAALAELDRCLSEKARGFGLDSLYPSVPEVLRGYVELVYDLQNRPAFRLIEPLLYRSDLYDRSAQSLVLSETAGDGRPFVLSTPRLPSDASIPLDLPFDHPLVDDLFELKRTPRSAGQIADLARAANCVSEVFTSFFWDRPPRPYQPYQGRGVRWRYFGHACILIEANGVSILSDPVLSYTYESNISRYTYEDIPQRLDYVLITHNHQDHILFETLLQLRNKVVTFVVPRSKGGTLQDPSLKLMLNNIGCRNVVELDEFDEIEFDGGSITGVPFMGEHGDLDIGTKLGYWVRFNRHSVLVLADSCNLDPTIYERVQRQVGNARAVFIGMECDGAPMSWLYGPLITRNLDRKCDADRRLAGSDFRQAQEIVKCFKPKEVYVYAMGQEPWIGISRAFATPVNLGPLLNLIGC